MRPFARKDVQARIEAAATTHRTRLYALRETILAVGDSLAAIGGVEETLKWGEPSYLPVKSRVGTTIRLGVFDDEHVAMYFNCNSMLVETMRSTFGDAVAYSKNRAVLFDVARPLPTDIVRQCAHLALNYHRDKQRS